MFENYKKLAEKLNHILSPKLKININNNQEKIRENVKNVLNFIGDWLLIFDDVQRESTEDENNFLAWLPSKNKQYNHIIITSKNKKWQQIVNLPLEQFNKEKSLELLHRIIKNDSHIQFSEKEIEEIDPLINILSGLPLALVQAAVYIRNTGETIGEYVKLLNSNQLWQSEQSRLVDYQRNVVTTWKVSIDKINNNGQAKKTYQTAINLLKISAFFAHNNIPRKLLQAFIEDKLLFNDAIGILKDLFTC